VTGKFFLTWNFKRRIAVTGLGGTIVEPESGEGGYI